MVSWVRSCAYLGRPSSGWRTQSVVVELVRFGLSSLMSAGATLKCFHALSTTDVLVCVPAQSSYVSCARRCVCIGATSVFHCVASTRHCKPEGVHAHATPWLRLQQPVLGPDHMAVLGIHVD